MAATSGGAKKPSGAQKKPAATRAKAPSKPAPKPIRREVGGRLRLRKTPELKFIADDSVEQGIEIFKKIENFGMRDENDED